MTQGGVVEDMYLGGSLSLRIRFTGVDSIVITGTSKSPVILDICDSDVSFKPMETPVGSLGLPGKRSALNFSAEKFVLDDYFTTPEDFLYLIRGIKNH